MGVDEVSVDLRSLGDFRERLEPRRQEVEAALAALADARRPALGQFHDAELTAQRYDALREGYLLRLRRLVNAMTAAQIATGTALTAYRAVEEISESATRAVAGLPSPGDKAFGDGLNSGR